MYISGRSVPLNGVGDDLGVREEEVQDACARDRARTFRKMGREAAVIAAVHGPKMIKAHGAKLVSGSDVLATTLVLTFHRLIRRGPSALIAR